MKMIGNDTHLMRRLMSHKSNKRTMLLVTASCEKKTPKKHTHTQNKNMAHETSTVAQWCGIYPRPGHTKDFKNGTSCSFAWCLALRK